MIELEKTVRLDEIEVTGESREVIINKRYYDLEKDTVTLYFEWAPGRNYNFKLKTGDGEFETSAIAPRRGVDPVSVELLIPYGGWQKDSGSGGDTDQTSGTLIMEGGTVTGAVIFTNYLPLNVEFNCTINIPDGLKISGIKKVSEVSEKVHTLNVEATLSVPYEKHHESFEITAGIPGEYVIYAEIDVRTGAEDIKYRREIIVRVESRKKMMNSVTLVNSAMPTRLDGRRDERKRQDSIYVRPYIFKKMARIFRRAEKYEEPYVPSTYQSIDLKSNMDIPSSYLVIADVQYMNREETPEYFYPPDEYRGGRKDISVIVASTLMPGETTRVVLPLFVQSSVPSGEYRRMIRLVPMGAMDAAAEFELPLYVTSMNTAAFIFTAGAVIVSLIVTGFLLFGFSGMVSSLKIRWIVIVALYGAMTFAVLNVPIRIFGAILSAISGPFGVFFTGIFSDMLYLILLVSLVRSIPRPGIITLTIIIRYILNGIFFGGIHFSDILFSGVSIAAMEAAFYVSGITRKKEKFKWTPLSTAFVALCLSSANVLLILTNIYLFMSLFRLFYAGWYIALNVLIDGVLYTWLAVYIGKRFSDKLKWTDV